MKITIMFFALVCSVATSTVFAAECKNWRRTYTVNPYDCYRAMSTAHVKLSGADGYYQFITGSRSSRSRWQFVGWSQNTNDVQSKENALAFWHNAELTYCTASKLVKKLRRYQYRALLDAGEILAPIPSCKG